jgi:hypothetical protein
MIRCKVYGRGRSSSNRYTIPEFDRPTEKNHKITCRNADVRGDRQTGHLSSASLEYYRYNNLLNRLMTHVLETEELNGYTQIVIVRFVKSARL